MNRKQKCGFSAVELIFVLALLSVLSAISVPGIVHARDVFSVRAARDALVAAAARTRSLAVARGGAELRVDERGVISLVGRDQVTELASWDLHERYGITLRIENSARTVAALHYDQLGVGRLASLTVRLQRGRASGAVTFSAYGRPRAW